MSTDKWNIFESKHGGRFNACVGDNSLHDLKTYADGYIEASTLLLNTIMEKKLIGKTDILVHPILYSARHAIELSLKYVLFELNKCDFKTDERKITGHNLSSLWTLFDDLSQKDTRLRRCFLSIDPILTLLDAADPEAQDFRYPEGNAKKDQSAKQTLEGRRIVDLVTVHEMVSFLKKQLTSLNSIAVVVTTERNLGTYTQDLNREELKKLAQDCAEGTPPYYPEVKKAWNKSQNLSGRGFERAMEKIASHREFSGYLGKEQELIALPTELLDVLFETKLKEVRDQLAQAKKRGNKRILTVDDIADSITDDFPEYQIYKVLQNQLTPSVIAELETLYYFAYLGEYSENYEIRYETYLTCLNSEKRIEKSFLHIYSKANLLENIIKSLQSIGQITKSTEYKTHLEAVKQESIGEPEAKAALRAT